ncbi:DNA alkylation repair protein [Cohnella mopanensis]|uniref:DNA alkylation repair protein n=1 Tax=Cohnella mopanensis TaxID=2911966 RepID=UPI001EF7953D|nr:DNA alkylation repair protein [Cohnella mopanensis]
MAEPLKAMYNESFLRAFIDIVKRAYPSFPGETFVRLSLGAGWDELELKGRMRRITESLGATLPADYEQALDVLEAIADECRGFPYLIFPDFVEVYGLEHWERSVSALAKFTRMSSSEFAVRPFLKKDQQRMMAQMYEWSQHPNEHIRRLASEGCRPRLPWADALPALKRDPSPIWPILEQLKADPSEYVRRSVANNLNDISKDHPEQVRSIAQAWIGHNEHTDWVIRHACRGLLRAADPETMALFGIVPQPDIEVTEWSVNPLAVEIGGATEFRYELLAPQGESVKLRIELAVLFPRSTGKSYRKLFKLSEKTVSGGSALQGGRRFSFADLSTRRHYPGIHRLTLVVNGQEVASVEVELYEGAQPSDSDAKRTGGGSGTR